MGIFASKVKVLPEPLGPFSVGCVDLQVESLIGEPNSDKGLLMRLYYPTNKTDLTTFRLVDWIPRLDYLKGSASFIGMNYKYFKFLYDWGQGHVHCPAIYHAPVCVPENGSLPILVFSHGLAGMRTVYSSICIDMASRGFIVAAVEHRDRSACWTYWNNPKVFEEIPIEFRKVPENDAEFSIRNVQVQHRATECLRTLDVLKMLNDGSLLDSIEFKVMKDTNFEWNLFKGKLDLSKCCIAGHSFGGATTVQVLGGQSEFKCGVVLGCWMVPIAEDLRLNKRALFLSTEWQWKHNFDRIQQQAHQHNNPSYTLKGSVHQSQCDWTFLVEGYWGRKFKSRGQADPFVLHKINCDLMASYLKDKLEIEGEPSFEEVLKRDRQYLSHEFKKEGPSHEGVL